MDILSLALDSHDGILENTWVGSASLAVRPTSGFLSLPSYSVRSGWMLLGRFDFVFFFKFLMDAVGQIRLWFFFQIFDGC